MSNNQDEQKEKRTASPREAGSPSPTAGWEVVKNQHFGLKLGAAFAVLIAILVGIGILGLSRMDDINANLEDVLGRRWVKLQLAREALRRETGRQPDATRP